jgi:hypothetical protein
VAHDGSLDEQFAYFATEELWFPSGSTVTLGQPGAYAKQSVDFVKNWKTPMLVVPAEEITTRETGGFATSPRCSVGNPEQALYFPDENHRAQAEQQCPVVRHRARLAGSLDEARRPRVKRARRRSAFDWA